MKDEKKTETSKQDKKKLSLKDLNLHMPKLSLNKKEDPSDSTAESETKKIKKVPKRNGITVSSGKKKKKLVNSALQKTEETVEVSAQKTETEKEKTKRRPGRSNKKSRDLTTSSHTAQRIDRERQKIRAERKEARKAELFKQRLIIGGVAAAVLLLILLLTACPGGKKEKSEAEEAIAASSTELEAGMAAVSSSEVRHFSFGVLVSDEMAGDSSVLTVTQFRQILQQLYDSNYILVDAYSIAEVQEKEDGSTAFTRTSLEIPAGKIPFVLSMRDASYSLDRIGKGYASKLIIGENSQITDEYQRSNGEILNGAYDVVTILEEFIAEHPDFAYENARGIIGLTGYNGILGYRTTETLAKSLEEGNSYAVYGVFDVNAEIQACQPVVEALKNNGWHFACYGYNYCSYGAEYDMMQSDLDSWMSSVSTLIGGTDLMLFPCETDIGNWSEYTEDNQKYQYLRSRGMNYFFIEEKANPSWLQIRSGYVRQGIKEIDCYDDFTQIMGE